MIVPNTVRRRMNGLGDFFDVADFVDFGSEALDFGADAFDFGADFAADVADFSDFGDFDFAPEDYAFDAVDDYGNGFDTFGTDENGGGFSDFGTDETTGGFGDFGTDEAGDGFGEFGTDETSLDLTGDDMTGAEMVNQGVYEPVDELFKPSVSSSSGAPAAPRASIPSATGAPLSASDLLKLAQYGAKAMELYQTGQTTALRSEIQRQQLLAAQRGTALPAIPGVAKSSTLKDLIDAVTKKVQANPWIIPALAVGGGLLLLKGGKNETQIQRRKRSRSRSQQRQLASGRGNGGTR